VTPEFVWRMEDVLDLYEAPADPKRPRVCFDEMPLQLISETRAPLPARPGQAQRFDYEYRREGTCNLFLFFSPDTAWREVKVTQRRTALDFAHCMRELVDVHFPEAEVVRVVLDNLNTHTPASLYQAFPAEEARRITERLQFHHTPKHASWLNMAEVEFSVLGKQCLDRRLPSIEAVQRETSAWSRMRNASGATTYWRFTTAQAREKFASRYPSPQTR
jgi:hypothetical protein